MMRPAVSLILLFFLLILLIAQSPAAAVDVPFQAHFDVYMESSTAVGGDDLDGDGDLDVAAVSSSTDELAWLQNDRTPPSFFTRYKIVDLLSGPYRVIGATTVDAADLDGDLDRDLVTGGTSKIAWYRNTGGQTPSFLIASTTTIATVAQARQVFAIDVDGDGDRDVLAAISGSDKVAWYENDGASTPSFTERVIVDSGSGMDRAADARSVFAADLDGDTDMDVLSASSGDNKIAWYESDGGAPPSFTPRAITTSATGARWVTAGDLDGDGDVDVASADYSGNTVAWYENDGGAPPGFTRRVVSVAMQLPTFITIADLDRDGDPDLVAHSPGASAGVTWYENLGGSPPAFQERKPSIIGSDTINIFAGDLDGDTDIDLVGGETAPDTVIRYENLLPPPPIPALGLAGAGTFLLIAAALALYARRRRRGAGAG